MRQELIRVLDALYEDIKATPFIEFLKEKYENFDFRVKLSDYLTKPMNELIETIKDIMADGEWKDFLSTLHSYVEKVNIFLKSRNVSCRVISRLAE